MHGILVIIVTYCNILSALCSLFDTVMPREATRRNDVVICVRQWAVGTVACCSWPPLLAEDAVFVLIFLCGDIREALLYLHVPYVQKCGRFRRHNDVKSRCTVLRSSWSWSFAPWAVSSSDSGPQQTPTKQMTPTKSGRISWVPWSCHRVPAVESSERDFRVV